MARSGKVKSSPVSGLQRQLCHKKAQFIIIPYFNEIPECISAHSRLIYARVEISHRRSFKALFHESFRAFDVNNGSDTTENRTTIEMARIIFSLKFRSAFTDGKRKIGLLI